MKNKIKNTNRKLSYKVYDEYSRPTYMSRDRFLKSFEYNLGVANEFKDITKKEANALYKEMSNKYQPHYEETNGFSYEIVYGRNRKKQLKKRK